MIHFALQKYQMLRPGERVLVACSGGPDSVALFHLLREMSPALKLKLHLLHFDHALRPGSGKDAVFVRNLARRYHVPFHGKRYRVPASHHCETAPSNDLRLSPEEYARKIRYAFFEETAKKTGIRKIALAHHRDDQAETVLMRVLQGTGTRGLQGIRPVLKMKGITYIRPLIETRREDILSYIKEGEHRFRQDPTNRSRRFIRNRIRYSLLPFLETEYNPRVRESLARLAESAREESAGLDRWVRERFKDFIKSRRKKELQWDRPKFIRLPSLLQFRLVDHALRVLDPRSGLDFKAWQGIEKGLAAGGLRVNLPGNIDFQFTQKRFFLRKNATI